MIFRYFSVVTLTFFTACTPMTRQAIEIPQPLRTPGAEAQDAPPQQAVPQQTSGLRRLQSSSPPMVEGRQGFALAPEGGADSLNFAFRQPIQLNLSNVPLPAFINEVFGNLLGLSFQISPSLQKKQDLVSLRITQPLPPRELYLTAREVLRKYGVSVIHRDALLSFTVATQQNHSADEIPLLVSGDTLPEVPESHRSVFQVVPLKALQQRDIYSLLKQVYQLPDLSITEDPLRNAILLSGPPTQVTRAAEAIRLLDRPLMQGHRSLRIQPAFLGAEKLAEQLVNMLKAEGYNAGIGVGGIKPAIIVLPVRETNSIFVFARDGKILAHVRAWAETLDAPGHLTDTNGLFFYPVQNTPAKSIADSLAPLLQNLSAASAMHEADNPAPGNNPAPRMRRRAAGSSLVVDEPRNMLLYQGNAAEWARLLPVIEALDQAPKLVLIEVTVAQVLLTDVEQFGIEWLLQNSMGDGYRNTFGTLDGLELPGAGFNYTLFNGLGQTRALLNALAADSRVDVLSSPRLLVKSGETASINVGSDVPVVTSQSIADAGAQKEGTSALMQEIQYRKTGVDLAVKAIVHAGGNRVDLEINQGVSQAQPNTLTEIDSPVILNRSIETRISLGDGGSVLLGGLISDTYGEGSSGVPGLSKLPLVGGLFRVDRKNRERNELIILIVPYVIDSDDEAHDITEAFRRQLSWDTDEEKAQD